MPPATHLKLIHQFCQKLRISQGQNLSRPISTMDIKDMRMPYLGKEDAFTEDQLDSKDPIKQFKAWFEQASKVQGIEEPNAMCLATATKEGRPSARMVLLKGFGNEGFIFFTNYESRKGRELSENPFASLNFHWEPMRRCVRVEGRVQKIPEQESTDYFKSRPLGSQVGAIVSSQSQPIPNRDLLQIHASELEEKAKVQPDIISKPKSWGGFRVIPDCIEFWQGQTNRIHDRIRFRKKQPEENLDNLITHEGENGWVYERLAP